jgi:hypothetical protein
MWGLIILLVLLIPLAAVVLDSRLGQALARRVEGGAPDSARLRAMEGEVERLSADLERISEQSDFLTRLLEERTESGTREGRSLPSSGEAE